MQYGFDNFHKEQLHKFPPFAGSLISIFITSEAARNEPEAIRKAPDDNITAGVDTRSEHEDNIGERIGTRNAPEDDIPAQDIAYNTRADNLPRRFGPKVRACAKDWRHIQTCAWLHSFRTIKIAVPTTAIAV